MTLSTQWFPAAASPTIADYSTVRGDTFRLDIQVLSASGSPVDITNWLLAFSIRLYAKGLKQQVVAAYNSTDNPDNVNVTSAIEGKFSIIMPPTDTEKLPDYVTTMTYDVQMGLVSTHIIYTLQMGTITLVPDITPGPNVDPPA